MTIRTHSLCTRSAGLLLAVGLLGLNAAGCEVPQGWPLESTETPDFGPFEEGPPASAEPAPTSVSGTEPGSVVTGGADSSWTSSEAFVVVTASDDFTCGVRSDDSGVTCWGATEAIEGGMPGDGAFLTVDAGGQAACAIRPSGELSCWGVTTGDLSVFEGVPVAQVDVGHGGQVCAVTTHGYVLCAAEEDHVDWWGISQAPEGSDWLQVVGGDAHTCALREDGTVSCWGRDDDAVYAAQLAPPAGATFIELSAGAYHTCGVTAGDEVLCWGAGETRTELRPSAALAHVGQADPIPGADFFSVASGAYHSCGLMFDGQVMCWGDGSAGQLGAPDRDDFIGLTAGAWHTCGLTLGGEVTCWGGESYAYLP